MPANRCQRPRKKKDNFGQARLTPTTPSGTSIGRSLRAVVRIFGVLILRFLPPLTGRVRAQLRPGYLATQPIAGANVNEVRSPSALRRKRHVRWLRRRAHFAYFATDTSRLVPVPVSMGNRGESPDSSPPLESTVELSLMPASLGVAADRNEWSTLRGPVRPQCTCDRCVDAGRSSR
jgi:hypothetical protein